MAELLNTVLHCPRTLRAQWPSPLARQWMSAYDMFDDDDLHLAHTQPLNHFYEWFTAIYLFHRDGVRSVIEKYDFARHPRKRALAAELLGSKLDALHQLCEDCRVQTPDLLVYSADRRRVWLAEVKGNTDRLSTKQARSHARIVAELGIDLELVTVRLSPAKRTV